MYLSSHCNKCVCVDVSDLRWVQVNSSEEAYRVMKIGKKNQSFSATRLNQLSSRRSEKRLINAPQLYAVTLTQIQVSQHAALLTYNLNIIEASTKDSNPPRPSGEPGRTLSDRFCSRGSSCSIVRGSVGKQTTPAGMFCVSAATASSPSGSSESTTAASPESSESASKMSSHVSPPSDLRCR